MTPVPRHHLPPDALPSRCPPAAPGTGGDLPRARLAAEAALAEGSRRLYAPRREAQVLALRLSRRAR